MWNGFLFDADDMRRLALPLAECGLRIAQDASFDAVAWSLHAEIQAAIEWVLLAERRRAPADARRAYYSGLDVTLRDLLARMRLPTYGWDFGKPMPVLLEWAPLHDLAMLAHELPTPSLPDDLWGIQDGQAIRSLAQTFGRPRAGLDGEVSYLDQQEAFARAVQQNLIQLAPRVLGLLLAAAEIGERREGQRRRPGASRSRFPTPVFRGLSAAHFQLFGSAPRIIGPGREHNGPSIRWARAVLEHVADKLPEVTPLPELQAAAGPIRELAESSDTTLGRHFSRGVASYRVLLRNEHTGDRRSSEAN